MNDSTDRELLVRGTVPERLDRAIAAALPELSRGEARRRITAGSVFVNGRRCRIASREVREGDRIRVARAPSGRGLVDLPILFEDGVVAVVDKAAGLPAAPTRSASAGTALELLREKLRRRTKKKEPIRLVHRLDAATSGAMIFALTRSAAAVLSQAFREHRIGKTYLALVDGVLEEDSGTIDLPIFWDGRRARISPAGKPAITVWHVRERRQGATLVELSPQTGRTHQLRLHLSAIGHAIVGDRSYGGTRASRLMLHASTLRFPHPVSGATQEVCAPTPSELTGPR